MEQPSPVKTTCGFACPIGYFLRDDPKRAHFQFVCQENGSWSGEIHTCVGKVLSN